MPVGSLYVRRCTFVVIRSSLLVAVGQPLYGTVAVGQSLLVVRARSLWLGCFVSVGFLSVGRC